MRIEFIIDLKDKVLLKEDLILNKLNRHYIITINIEENGNYSLFAVKNLLFLGHDKNLNEVFRIRHLKQKDYFLFESIIEEKENRLFIIKQINSRWKNKFNNNQIPQFQELNRFQTF